MAQIASESDLTSRLERQISFILEIDKMKQILRRSYITDGSKLENDAEHSWHIAMMAFILSEYASDPNIDTLHVMKMLLVHDVVEIDAGDCFVYADATGKAEREQAAADRIFAILPDDQAAELRSLWNEFEEHATTEARFARAMDRFQPVLLNVSAHGKTWQEHGVTVDQAMNLNVPILAEGAPELAHYVKQLLNDAFAQGCFQPPKSNL